MFKKFFNEKDFDFIGFHGFVFNLVDNYKMSQIVFRPENKELFTQYQLTHIAPYRDINNRDGFIWAWRKKQDIVRRISFDQFSNDQTRKITITIDLAEKSISLDKEEGISSIEVEDVLTKNIKDLTSESGQKNKAGQFPGVFIAARKIVNNGEIFAEGPGYKTEIITEDYKGKGKVSAKNNSKLEKKWHQEWWGQIIIGLIVLIFGSVILKILNVIK